MNKNGLLFYLHGNSPDAYSASGDGAAAYYQNVTTETDPNFGPYFNCTDYQLFCYNAPHNIYAARGTLSFFWRSRYPAGKTAFPIFRVAFADHSSWDAVFMRIDYNGEGLDAFITDNDLKRARVHKVIKDFPDENTWMHIACSWDENYGIKLYLNGKLIGEEYRPAHYDAGLDKFGPHARIAANWQVQSAYNFMRGGDIAKLAIYDRMLSDDNIATLSSGDLCDAETEASPEAFENYKRHYGLDGVLPKITTPTIAKKIGILDAYDLKRWWYKALDGIFETTWPGVFNRSRLKGRNDYFQLPDWDCYSTSGKAITFTVSEPFNRIEIQGSASGKVELVDKKMMGDAISPLFERRADFGRTVHEIAPQSNGFVRITNDLIEEPISDFSAFNVTNGAAPKGAKKVTYKVSPGLPMDEEIKSHILGRYLIENRNIYTTDPVAPAKAIPSPMAHIVLPYEADDAFGLDGVQLKLAASNKARNYSVTVFDPLWYYRSLARFTFAADANTPVDLFIDTRDRILPEGKTVYILICTDDESFDITALDPEISLIYKPFEEAKFEHVADRFNQVRDVYGHLTEEHPGSMKLAMFKRFYFDVSDLLKVDPTHKQGQYYFYDKFVNYKARLAPDAPRFDDFKPDFKTADVPEGIPTWAFKQIEYLKRYKYVVNWYIDNRQIENGELGGGLSDDGDFVCTWASLVNMGSEPDKILAAMNANMEAFYDQGLFTNGLSSIQADELHSSEEGLISLNGCLNADFANPRMLERAMETARSAFWISGINAAGHRHIKSVYFSGSRISSDAPWNVQKGSSYAALSPVWQVSRFNGNKKVQKLLLEFADGMKAHHHEDERRINMHVRFHDDVELPDGNPGMPLKGHEAAKGDKRPAFVRNPSHLTQYSIMSAVYHQLGDRSYMDLMDQPPLPDYSNIPAWREEVAKKYDEMAYIAGMREYYNTEGHPWIDRVYITANGLMSDRLANPYGIENRFIYPANRIAWRFDEKGDDERVAILTPVAEKDQVKIIVHNISDRPVYASVLANEVTPGKWSVTYGKDTDLDDNADADLISYTVKWERGLPACVRLAPNCQTVITLSLVEEATPYSERCDLGITKEDITFYAHGMNVKIHSVGAIPSPEVDVVLKDKKGNVLYRETLPPLEAPTDLWPKYREVIFPTWFIDDLAGCYIEIDPDNTLNEITRLNNIVRL